MEEQVVSVTEQLTLLVVQLGVVVFAAWAGGKIFHRFRLPGVLGEIMAGVVIGPYALGGFPVYGFSGGVFPLAGSFAVSVELYSIATIASIILLFLVGLETDIDTFLRFSLVGSVVGVVGVVVSFAAGVYAAVLMSPYFLGIQLGIYHPTALFMGVMSTATSVGISARILSQNRKMDSPEGVTILSAAVIDDVLGIIVLAIVLGMVKSAHIGWQEISWISFRAIGVWLGFTVLGLTFSRRIGQALKRAKDRVTIAIFSLSLALILAAVFEKSGLAMIIGAYVMGLTLSKTDLAFMIQEKLEVLVKFFVPVFFCVMGMLVNLREIASPAIILAGGVYLALAVLGKILGCGVPALFMNFNLRGALRVGIGMVPRGEVALIIAGVGLANGIIGDEVFGVAIIMTFLTTLLTPPVFDRLLRSGKPVLRKQGPAAEEHKVINYGMPNQQTAELLLGKVLSAFDGEGFYIYRTDIPEQTYHIRKDSTFIMMKYTPENLSFYCPERDAAFIHTLFYEVIAEFRNIVKNVQSYSNRTQVGKDIFQVPEAPRPASGTNFAKLVSPLAVEVNLQGVTKKEIIKELIAILVRSGQVAFPKINVIYEEIGRREETMSTGMQDGVALPHIKSVEVDKLVFAIGIKKDGVDFDAFDQQPSRIFVLALAPFNRSEAYLQAIARISQFLASESNRQRFISCRDNVELYDVINDV
jgi:Kef-type K+ transport system membrane component KefB/mannitol/fructose-specific phosphotransferase system IIA component (Ntr-type)